MLLDIIDVRKSSPFSILKIDKIHRCLSPVNQIDKLYFRLNRDCRVTSVERINCRKLFHLNCDCCVLLWISLSGNRIFLKLDRSGGGRIV